MREVKRHSVSGYGRQDICYNDPEGEFVFYSDYKELEKRAEAAEAKLAELEKQQPVKVDDSMALAFHKALNDGGVGHEDLDEIKVGLVAALCNFTRPAPVADLAALVPSVCDGKEQEAFESYARQKGLDLSRHPLHYLFLDGKTNQARSAWRECLVYVRAAILRNIEGVK